MYRSSAILSTALFAAGALAQTYTSCTPLNATCPPDAALGTTYEVNFTASTTGLDPRFWTIEDGQDLMSFSNAGLNLPLTKYGDSITVVSTFYIMWGQYEINMRAAPGQGIISTAILLSDDLDEIDWEIIGSNTSFVENNYYGWGNQSQRNAIYNPLNNAQEDYHNYTVDWNQDRINYMIDGQVVRTVPYDVPGKYPQTPMRLRFGIWAGGDSPQNGTVQWAGGKCDWSQGPYVMDIKSIRVTDGTSNVTTYTYTDHSGAWQSIVGTAGVSAAYIAMHTLTASQLAQQRWNNLPMGAKIGIACGVAAVFLIGFILFAVYFFKQRRLGRAERAIADKEWEQHTNELASYRQMMAKGQFAVQHMGHGEKF